MTTEPFELQDEDVLKCSATALIKDEVFLGKAFISALTGRIAPTNPHHPEAARPDKPLLEQGLDCELLSPTAGGGWQKGKLKIQVVFVPESPPETVDGE